jgi:hypothetical protein
MNPSMERLLESGLGLVPIPKGEKGPCVSNWNARENIVTNAEEAWRLTSCNVAI